MKTLYLDCGMGAAGDMLTAALFELQEDREEALAGLNALGIPGVVFEAEPAVRCGITGTHMRVLVNGQEEEAGDDRVHEDEPNHRHGHAYEHHREHMDDHGHVHEHHHDYEDCHDHAHEHHHDHGDSHEHTHESNHNHGGSHCHTHENHHDHDHSHHHYSLGDILMIAGRMPVSDSVKKGVEAVYRRIAAAESKVHGRTVEEIHFHEVGAMDAVADVTAALWLFERLGVDQTVCSPVRTGFGEVHCAHGILPVPAPATAILLEGMPVFAGDIRGEMCTPTGAALLGYLADEFGTFSEMKLIKTGYGMGKKDFPGTANCLCARIGEKDSRSENTVVELICNIDDMTGEDLATAQEAVLKEGALDAWTVPVLMKKGRPGAELHVLAGEENRDAAVKAIFRFTSTIGIREAVMKRYVLDRREEAVETKYGPVRKKISEGYGVIKAKYEHDDLARIAKKAGKTISEVKEDLPG